MPSLFRISADCLFPTSSLIFSSSCLSMPFSVALLVTRVEIRKGIFEWCIIEAQYMWIFHCIYLVSFCTNYPDCSFPSTVLSSMRPLSTKFRSSSAQESLSLFVSCTSLSLCDMYDKSPISDFFLSLCGCSPLFMSQPSVESFFWPSPRGKQGLKSACFP